MPDPTAITKLDDIAIVLRSPDFRPVDYAARHLSLAAAMGFDATHIVSAINHVPLCLHGDRHAQARKRIARLINEGTENAMAVVETEVPEMIAQLHTPGHHDVMKEFVIPCVDRLISANTGLNITLPSDTLVSRLFSQTLGVAKRRRMNAELLALREKIAAQRPELSHEDISDRIVLFILGVDALRGTIARSMQLIYEGGLQQTSTEIARDYPATAVPYIDREATAACPIGGITYPTGTNFRARLDQFEERENQAHRNRFFGFGAHSCLGRKLALALWRTVVNSMRDHPANITVSDFKLRKDDVFAIPEVFEIEVIHD